MAAREARVRIQGWPSLRGYPCSRKWSPMQILTPRHEWTPWVLNLKEIGTCEVGVGMKTGRNNTEYMGRERNLTKIYYMHI